MLEGAHLLFCAHRLCMNYAIAMLLLVSYVCAHNYFLHFARFFVERISTIYNKNIQQRTLSGLITIPSINVETLKFFSLKENKRPLFTLSSFSFNFSGITEETY